MMTHRQAIAGSLVLAALLCGFLALQWTETATTESAIIPPHAPTQTPSSELVLVAPTGTAVALQTPSTHPGNGGAASDVQTAAETPHHHEGEARATVRRPWRAEELQSLFDRQVGDAVVFELADGRKAEGRLTQLRSVDGQVLYAAGRLQSPEEGQFFFQRQTVTGVAGDFVGIVEFPRSGTAFRLEPTPQGGTEMVARLLTEVKCVGLPPPAEKAKAPVAALDWNPEAGTLPQTPVYQGGVPALESLPRSTPVIYLDFDGEYTPTWGGIDAAAAGMSSGSISDFWRRVSADYLPYNINVTTDRRVFDNAPEGSRQHCIITPTTDAAPGAGGVSYIGSFNWSGDTPNWVFIRSGDSGAEAASHECGHALGLGHDGQDISTNHVEYYAGHGTGELEWSPIMGVGYYTPFSQWSKGEYPYANNRQDDLNIIDANNNNVAYRSDEHGSNFVGASWMELYPGNRLTNEGIIARNTDVDGFRFATTGGVIDVTVSTAMAEKQIAYNADITDTNNTVLYSFTSTTSLNVRVVTNLTAGEYSLRIRGAARGNTNTGFTAYACLGYYKVTGTVAGGVLPTRFTVAENSTNGTIIGLITNSSPTDPHVYVVTRGSTGNAVSVSSSGVVTVATSSMLNFEAREWVDLLVTVSNTANPLLDEPNRRIVVQIANSNETPVFAAAGPFVVFAGTSAGTEVGTLTATDADDYTRLRYSISGGNSNSTFAIDPDDGALTVNNTVVRPANTNFNLLIRAVDASGAGAKTGTINVVINVLSNVAHTANGGAAYSYFGGIGSGTTVADLTGNARWPHDPTFVTILPSAEAPEDQADSFGAVLRAWLQVPFSGNYQFALASDDAGELRFSTNGVPTNTTVIASVSSWTAPQEWTKFASQKSALLNLQVGQLYYIEARKKEGSGGDNLAIAWSNATMGVSGPTVIAGQFLAPHFIDPLPAPFQSRDLGEVGSPGLASFYMGGYAVDGSGTDIWGTNDQFQFVSMPFSGSGLVEARITAQRASHPFAKSGVMLRDSTANNAAFFDVLVTPSNGVAIQYRNTASGNCVNVYGPTSALPVWVRAVRSNNTFRGYYSTNRSTWIQIGSAQAIVMANPLEAGLCVTAHDNALTNLTKCSGLSVLPFNWQNDDIGMVGKPGGAWYDPDAENWTVMGSGTDVGGTIDQFNFAHQPVAGDATLLTRVAEQAFSATSAKAGLMLRESTASNAAYVTLYLQPSGGLKRIQMAYRSMLGAAAVSSATITNLHAPYWLRLVRSGSNFTGSISSDGTNWTPTGSANLGLPALARGGLFVAAGANTNLGAAVFDGFSATLSERDFVWTNAPGGVWSDGSGWTNGAAPNLGGTRDYAITILAASNSVLTNDLGSSTNGGLVLNAFAITQRVATITGSNLVLRSSSDGEAPVVWNTTTGAVLSSGIVLADTATFNGNSGQTMTLGGPVRGTGSLVKSGNNTLILASSNSYALTRVTGGSLQLGGTGTFGTGEVTNNGTLVFARTGTYTIANAIVGTGGLHKNTDNNGVLVLAATNGFTGGVTVGAGAILIRNSEALGVGSKTITMTAGSAGNANLKLDGTGGGITLGTNIAFSTSNASGSLFNAGGTNVLLGNITLTGGGGNTVLVVSTGRLTVAGNLAPNTTNRGLDLRGDGDGEISGTIADGGVSNILVVRKDAGVGRWRLSGTNSYSGTTQVSAGALIVDGTLATGAVTVSAGGTLGGTGTIAGPIIITGTLRPGSSAPGILSTAHAVTFQTGSKFIVDLGGYSTATGFSALATAGPAVLAGTLELRFTNGFENIVSNGTTFVALSAGSVTGAFVNATNGTLLYAGLGRFAVAANTTRVSLTYQATRAPFAAWQATYFGCTNCPQAAATNDSDGDGMSNWSEYLSGTSPTNVASLLRIVSLSVTSNNLLVVWSAVSNALYVVEAGDVTNATLPAIGSVATAGGAVTQTNFLQAGGANGVSSRIYRVRLLAP